MLLKMLHNKSCTNNVLRKCTEAHKTLVGEEAKGGHARVGYGMKLPFTLELCDRMAVCIYATI